MTTQQITRDSEVKRTARWREFIPAPPSVITEESWSARNALVDKHLPYIYDLTKFSDAKLAEILIDVEQDFKPPREFPIGPGPRPLAWLPKRSHLEWHLFRGIVPGTKRTPIPPAVRAIVMERDGLICRICGGEVRPDDVHLDHIKPWSRGGQHTVKNLRVTHSLCNMKRGAPADGS